MLGRRLFRSAVPFALLLLGALLASPPPAQAQSPWSGIAADEAKVPGPFNYGSNDMSPRSLSADGRFVVFHSNLANLVPNDTNNWNDVFLRDRVTRELTRVSVSTSGVEANNWSAYPSISADGRHISFYSCATNLVAGDTNDMCDFFVRDRELGTTVRVSVGPNGEESTSLGAFYQARLSADGRYVVFPSAFGAGAIAHVWLRDRDTDGNGVFDEPGLSSTTQISSDWIQGLRIDGVVDAAISNDARYVAFVGQTCDEFSYNCIGYRMYVHDRVTAQTFRVDLPAAGYFDENAYSFSPDFSDTALLTYTSTQPNLVEGHVNPNGDIYVFNLITGGNVLIQPGAALDYFWTPQISADGRYVAFMGGTWNYGNPAYNVYAFDRQTLETTLVSAHPDGSADDNASAPSMTADGSGIAFAADAGMLPDGWGSRGIFVATGVALTPADTDVPEIGGTYTIELTAPATTGWELQFGSNAIVNPSSGAGSATIEVTIAPNTTPDDMTTLVILGSQKAAFHQTAPPQIYYTMPYYGPPSGGTDVDIFGAGFAEGMAVEFGGTPATNVTFIDSSHIVATTPAHAGGWVNVKVTKASGASAELFYMFYYDDPTPPTVTPVVTGTLGANGWYTSDVTVTWTVEDNESEILSEPCAPFTLTSDVALTFAVCEAYSYGGTTISEIQIKRDATPPVATLYNPVDTEWVQGTDYQPLDFACDDATSGVISCTPSQTSGFLDTTVLGTRQFTLTAVDQAGLSGSTAFTYNVKRSSSIYTEPVAAVYGAPANLWGWAITGGGGIWPFAAIVNKPLTFLVDGVIVGTALTDTNGNATLPVSGIAAGSHVVRVEYAGDAEDRPAFRVSTLNVAKATPVITWPTPSFIVAGTPLGSTQLNATASVAGSLAYTPGFSTVLAPGTHTLTVQFTPQDAANYVAVSKTVTLTVKAIPVITWPAPAAITYPASLSATQLNATANVAGSFVYTPPAGTVLDAGTHAISVTFTPSNTADYISESSTTTLEVLKGTVTITWPNLNPITYGAMLTGLHLNAQASAEGGFTYSPPYGTILNAGTHTVTATFTPNAPNNYHPATATRDIVVNKAYPVVNWPGNLAPIVYGTPLGAAQLYATSPNAGTIAYNPPAGTLLDAGLRTITMTFTPDDPANYHAVTLQKQIAVDKQTTTVTWNDTRVIVYGTALSAAELNATASTAGSFAYDPPAGTVLNAGNYMMRVYFTPDNPNYYGGTWYLPLVVLKRTPVITWSNPAPITYGTPISATQLNATVSGGGSGALQFNPGLGTVLNAGAARPLFAHFEPNDPANYNAVDASVTIDVLPAVPPITWDPPGDILYGSPLGGSQLDASATVPGTWAYSPPAGTVLGAGAHTLSGTFTPTSANWAVTTVTTSLTVLKASSGLMWSASAAVPYPTALSAAQLNATAAVPGTFAYSQPLGSVLAPGLHQLTVTFTPDDAANYNGATTSVYFTVNQTTPVVTWPSPAGIVYGTALSGAQLNATASVPGNFTYSPSAGAILPSGTHNLMATFHATDSNYNVASAIVTITVTKATPVVSWATPAGITFGQVLTANGQLNATANVAGSYVYSPAAGAALNAGSQTLSVTFTPYDTSYNTATASVTLDVAKATPVLSWANPASIQYGTALSSTQLNASANVAGTFAYSPAAGTVLPAGAHTLAATFTPADGANYNTPAPLSKNYFVSQRPLTLQVNNAGKVYGQALPAFSTTGTGFVNGDTIASLSGSPAYSTTATATSAPGTYSVSLNGVTSTNYTLTLQPGTLTISKASTSVAFTTTPNPSNNNQQVQLRGVVSAVAPGAGTATGTVEFREGTTLLGTATLVNGVATINKSFKRGSHALTATYVGNTNFNGSSGSLTHQVN